MSGSSKRKRKYPPRRKPSAPAMLAIVQRREEKQAVDARFGLCGQCRTWAGKFAREGKDVWLFCDVHRVRWFACDIGNELKGGGLDPRSIADFDEIDPVWPARDHPSAQLTPPPPI
jgi:hypothetical protein